MKDSAPIYLSGQTGCGKTAVSLELADLLSGMEIVNADAFQLYRGIEILSAAPDGTERSRARHHQFGVLDITEDCDAARFARMHQSTIEGLDQDARPLVVGGSGLYLKAVTHGLAPTPPGDPKLRAELDTLSLGELVSRYGELDPKGAAETNLKNRRYVTRNLEICLLTGEPASGLKSRWQRDSPEILGVFLKRERKDIYDRINRRTRQMFAAGVVEEVRVIEAVSATAEKAIGFREIRELLAGRMDEATCVEEISKQTRRYAKRQESWFRREPEFQEIIVGIEESPRETAQRILEAMIRV